MSVVGPRRFISNSFRLLLRPPTLLLLLLFSAFIRLEQFFHRAKLRAKYRYQPNQSESGARYFIISEKGAD